VSDISNLAQTPDLEPWKHQEPCNICGERHAGYEKAHFAQERSDEDDEREAQQ